MKRVLLLPVILASLTLAACSGGGGGGTSGGGGGGGILPPGPTPTPTAAPATVAGHVYQLAGPLAAGSATAPTAASTPSAGAAIAGATVYITTTAGALSAAVPATIVAQGTTAGDGSFSIAVAGAAGTQYGVIVMDGASLDTTTGEAGGKTIAHAIATAGTASTLYLDSLTSDESSAYGVLNSARATASLSNASADTSAIMVARIITQVANANASTTCYAPAALWGSTYASFGGAPATQVELMSSSPFQTTWAAGSTVGFQLQPNVVFAGFALLKNGSPCPSSGSALPQNLFAEILLTT